MVSPWLNESEDTRGRGSEVLWGAFLHGIVAMRPVV
jgi:hypothetical protein